MRCFRLSQLCLRCLRRWGRRVFSAPCPSVLRRGGREGPRGPVVPLVFWPPDHLSHWTKFTNLCTLGNFLFSVVFESSAIPNPHLDWLSFSPPFFQFEYWLFFFARSFYIFFSHLIIWVTGRNLRIHAPWEISYFLLFLNPPPFSIPTLIVHFFPSIFQFERWFFSRSSYILLSELITRILPKKHKQLWPMAVVIPMARVGAKGEAKGREAG